MPNSALTSYAILKVNWESGKSGQKDYLDNFVLIVAEAIRQLPQDIVVLSELQNQLKVSFELDIPQNTIKSLLNRVKNYGYIQLSHSVFTRNNSEIEKLNFREIQQEVLRAHETLIDGLVDFAQKEPYGLAWSVKKAEDALQEYLLENQIKLLSELTVPIVPNATAGSRINKNHKAQYIIAKYIELLRETRSSKLDYLETVIKGNLLANAIFMTDPSTYQRKFKDTSVFFDTPLVIYALGYAGEPRKWPAIELINLLKIHGAKLKIFRHSLQEITGILSACADRIRRKQFQDSYGPSIEYFIEKGYSEVDIMMFIENLESDLSSLGILIIEKPPYNEHEYVIGENAYSEYLAEKISYSRDRPLPLERDKDSIAAIFRLRRGEEFIAIEECKSIFVTSNSTLAYSTREYPEFHYHTGTAPLAVTDYELTNLVWLKDPTIAPKLPFKRLVADCFAATQPSDILWSKYLASIDQLEKQGKINNEQYFILRHSIQAKSELMEKTRGNDAAFTEGTVSEVLAIVEGKLRAEDIARVNQEILAKQEALSRAEQAEVDRIEFQERVNRREDARKNKIKMRAAKISRTISFVLIILLIVLLGYLSYLISSIGPLNVDPNNNIPYSAKVAALLVFWVLLFLQTLSLVTGFAAKTLLGRLELTIGKQIENFLDVDLENDLTD